jgi:transcriptional regulator with XRE-family HTH domain
MSNLKRIRETAGLSQSQLARLSGVSLPMIQKYEAGIRDINVAQALTLYKLAQALNCTIEELLEIEAVKNE